jgi:hypothetical protein
LADDSNFTITDSIVEDNLSRLSGGFMSIMTATSSVLFTSNVKLIDSTFDSNRVFYNGGLVNINNELAVLEITNSKLNGNLALGGDGGNVYALSAYSIKLEDNEITNAYTNGSGSVLFASSSSIQSVTLENNEITCREDYD